MRTVFVLTLLTAILCTSPALARNVLIVANSDFAPYSMEQNGIPAGIDVDVIQKAAAHSGINIDVIFRPWDEMEAMVVNGECDGAISFFQTPDREKKFIFMKKAPIHFSDYVLFTKVGDKFSFRSYDDLADRIIGRVKQTDLGTEFKSAMESGVVQVKEYPDQAAAIRGLVLGEIDAFAGNIDVTYYRLKDMGMTSSIVYLPKKIISKKPAYLVMSRSSNIENKEQIFRQLETSISRMWKDGSYNTIARKYLLRF